MDATQELKNTENALRDFIALILEANFGAAWFDESGVSADRLEKWKARKETETKRQKSGVVDERLIYYADFFDLRTILKKHWQLFSDVFGDWRSMEVWLTELERLRDPDAHRRELLPHQVHLILGIGGELRTRIVRYRSKHETAADYFPRIESARDSLGNMWVPGPSKLVSVHTESTLRPGDQIDFILTASDPRGENLRYGIGFGSSFKIAWGDNPVFSTTFTEKHIGSSFPVYLFVASLREYHAQGEYDQFVIFHYAVLPSR